MTHRSVRGLVDAGEHPEQFFLPAPFWANQADPVPIVDAQSDVPQGLDTHPVTGTLGDTATTSYMRKDFLQGAAAASIERKLNLDIVDRDEGHAFPKPSKKCDCEICGKTGMSQATLPLS